MLQMNQEKNRGCCIIGQLKTAGGKHLWETRKIYFW